MGRTIASRSGIAPFYVMEVMKAAAARERAGGDVLHLEVGQPSTPAPESVLDAAGRLLRDHRLAYTDALGTPELRGRIARWYDERYGVSVSPERIAIASGASGACVLDPATLKCTTVSLAPACDVSSMVEVGGRLVVVDAACGRTWFFPIAAADPLQLGPPSSVAAASGFQPVGVAQNPSRGDEVLVAEQAAITAATSVVQVSRVTLP